MLAWTALTLIGAPVPGPPGDYNSDGIVNAADYVVWCKIDGTQLGYDTWCANFGDTAAAGSSSHANAPEPGGALLLILGAAATRRRERPVESSKSGKSLGQLKLAHERSQ
jgi:MYXO-CTERM domain-containing protein